MTVIAFPGHTARCLRSWWPFARWRSLTRTVIAFPGHTACCLRSWWPFARWRSLTRTVAGVLT